MNGYGTISSLNVFKFGLYLRKREDALKQNVIEGPLGSKTGLSCRSKRTFLDEIAESFAGQQPT
jgi:hypothetical protein